MYPSPFHYHRAGTLAEAAAMMGELGEEACLLAGGQSLIPLMKLRLAGPRHLVDLNHVPDLSFVRESGNDLRLGPMTRHSQIARSELAAEIPVIADCASGIADPQIRNRGTIGGSLAEADPSGDWAPALLTLDTRVFTTSPRGERVFPLSSFVLDAYTTELETDEVIREIAVARPGEHSGGAYLAFKRSPQVYASAAVAVQLRFEPDLRTCRSVRIFLGAVGLTPIRAVEAEAELRGLEIGEDSIWKASRAAGQAADPQADLRGSADYKRTLVEALTRRGLGFAIRRARGERPEVSHLYA